VTIVILLVLVVVLWIVVLAPSAWRRRVERQGVGSIDHFHHQLQLLEHAGPKLVAPAYRLHTALPGRGADEAFSPVDSSRPKLVLLRPTDDEQSADVDGKDGCHYERVGLLDTPDQPVYSSESRGELAAYRRQQARLRCTMLLRCLTAVAVSTALLGMLPSMQLAWVFTAVAAVAALALVGIIAYAKELETQRHPRRSLRPYRAFEDEEHSRAASSGFPGAWDEEYHLTKQAAAH
jgi:membrane protein YdbS with pleckstrin-like domain